MADVKELAEQLVNLTIKEANELAKVLEEDYDIKPAAAAVAVAGQPVVVILVVLLKSRLNLMLYLRLLALRKLL